MDHAPTTFRSLDGLRLEGTLVVPDSSPRFAPAVLVHGGGVTREEGGFFTRLATGLAEVGVPSLRFDFRAHGESEGTFSELTLSGVANDIRAAADHVREVTGAAVVNLIAASFGGGCTVLAAATNPGMVEKLVLLYPSLNYRWRFVEDKPFFEDDRLSTDAARQLARHGLLPHSGTSFMLGRPLLNEVFHLQPQRMLDKVTVPTLIIHGTKDTFIPVEASRRAVELFGGPAELIEIEGAQHGFAVHEDPAYADPQTQQWQADVIATVASRLSSPHGDT